MDSAWPILKLMADEHSINTPEKRETLDDNARKFITEPLDAQFFDDKLVTSFTLVVDWLETDESSEKKLAYKTFDDSNTQILLISKITHADGSRKTLKEPLTSAQYDELAGESVLHLEKKRYEFKYEQAGNEFELKYDVFADNKLHMLEVDAAGDDMRAAFTPEEFPATLSEVTGNLDYYGYRVCGVL
jgi:hypothetical protein